MQETGIPKHEHALRPSRSVPLHPVPKPPAHHTHGRHAPLREHGSRQPRDRAPHAPEPDERATGTQVRANGSRPARKSERAHADPTVRSLRPPKTAGSSAAPRKTAPEARHGPKTIRTASGKNPTAPHITQTTVAQAAKTLRRSVREQKTPTLKSTQHTNNQTLENRMGGGGKKRVKNLRILQTKCINFALENRRFLA